ncbi:MAG TPA: phosphomannomutase [Paracoccaceae bacterium]|nr:phosphomannomutase [Paracoccaceae bacterium]
MAPKFGTSGLRGLVSELTDDLCADYTRAFLSLSDAGRVLMIGQDLRPSSPRMARAVARAATGLGVTVVDCGALPTPALALAADARGAAAIMVTGSHIPADRNGLKFYTRKGEITKADEGTILAHLGSAGGGTDGPAKADPHAAAAYLERYLDFFGAGALDGLRLGVWQHSSVARDLLADLLSRFGAEVVCLGRSETFIPVDTEAVGGDTRTLLRGWAVSERLDAILSTDGDADRPLLTDRTGAVIAGDVLGVLTARLLGADCVVTPVSSTTMIEASGAFARTIRTKIGSPYVIAGLEGARTDGCRAVGFEANGGFLLGFVAERSGRKLSPLLTRDAFLPLIAPLVAARAAGCNLAALLAALPARRTASDRLEHVPTERALALVGALTSDPTRRAAFFRDFGAEVAVDLTDGLRVTFADGLILHLRPSGNAPELRCYAEDRDAARAEAAMREVLARAKAQLQ